MKNFLSASILFVGILIPSLVSAQSNLVNSEYGAGLISTLIYAGVGIILCFLVYMLIDMMTPGHLAKQLAHEKNIALAIVVGAVMLGVSIIIAAAIHG
jgi:putative membrane protein